MTNKEYILKITDKDKFDRIEKILSCIHLDYILQPAEFSDIINIIVPAKVQKDKIAVIAHHDVHPKSFGYNDNSSGVVTLLKMQKFLPDNVELVFTDQEEYGGLGCRHYLENYPRPAQAVNLDVVGLPGKIFYEMYGQATFTVPAHLKEYRRIPFSDSYILDEYNVPNMLMLTGDNEDTLIRDIFNAQHGGKNDGNLALISENSMNCVFDALLLILKKRGERDDRKETDRRVSCRRCGA